MHKLKVAKSTYSRITFLVRDQVVKSLEYVAFAALRKKGGDEDFSLSGPYKTTHAKSVCQLSPRLCERSILDPVKGDCTMWPSTLFSVLTFLVVFGCHYCDREFNKVGNRNRHEARTHGDAFPAYQCKFCSERFPTFMALREHTSSHKPKTRFFIHASAFQSACCRYRFIPDVPHKTSTALIADCKPDLEKMLSFELASKTSVMAALVFHVVFVKDTPNLDGEYTEMEYCIRAKNHQLSLDSELDSFILQSVRNCDARVNDFIQNGSGWILREFTALDMDLTKCAPLNGSCSAVAVTTMGSFSGVHDVKQNCFLKAIAYHFTQTSDDTLITKFIDEHLSWSKPMPFEVRQIEEFERKNSHLDIRINVLASDGDEIFPLSRSNLLSGDIVNLLLHSVVHGNGGDEICNHFSYIDNLDRLLSKKYKNKNGKVTYYKGLRCENCLGRFWKRGKFEAHKTLCFLNKPQKIVVPFGEQATLQFKNFKNTTFVPTIICFDFEALNKPVLIPCVRCVNTQCVHKTKIEARQEPFCYSMAAITRYDEVIHQSTYSGLDAANHFLNTLLDLHPKLSDYCTQNVPMTYNEQDQEKFERATNCWICKLPLKGDKVRDHDHISGKFINAAHNVCNLKRAEVHDVPVYCHNLQGYDSHFILSAIKSDPRVVELSALPSNGQKLKTFTINGFKFIDSLDFLQGSLDAMVSALPASHSFNLLDQSNLYTPDDQALKKLLLQKGVYCYEWATSLEKLQETSQIPPHAAFHSRLTNKNISAEEYRHAKNVFASLECGDMLAYTEAYCTLDVFLLAEVLTAFRKEIMREVGLDCCHYISLPQLSFDMMLKVTQVKLDLMTDLDQLLFIENSIRGGLSFINQRYASEKSSPGPCRYIEYIDGEFGFNFTTPH